MTLIGFRASNHPQQTAAHGPKRDVDDRATTLDLYGPLEDQYRFTIDVAASADNTKCERFYSIGDNGLAQSWAGERVWCNPPYSDIRPWVAKAWDERDAELAVLLLPANRTEQGWWQDLIEPYRDRHGSPLSVSFLRGRYRFLAPGQRRVGANERPPFGMVLCVWQNVGPSIERQGTLL